MEEILAVTFIFGGGSLFLLSISPVGKAFAERIRFGTQSQPDPQLLEEVEQLRAEVAELHERVDFTERLIASQREADRLPG